MQALDYSASSPGIYLKFDGNTMQYLGYKMLWHVCWRPGLGNQQRQSLIGNDSAKRPLLGNGTIKTDSIMEHATPPIEVPRETVFLYCSRLQLHKLCAVRSEVIYRGTTGKTVGEYSVVRGLSEPSGSKIRSRVSWARNQEILCWRRPAANYQKVRSESDWAACMEADSNTPP